MYNDNCDHGNTHAFIFDISLVTQNEYCILLFYCRKYFMMNMNIFSLVIFDDEN